MKTNKLKRVLICLCLLTLCGTEVSASTSTFRPRGKAKPSYGYRYRRPAQKRKPQQRHRTNRAQQPIKHRAFAVPDSTAYYMNSNKQSLWGTSYRTTHPKKTRKR